MAACEQEHEAAERSSLLLRLVIETWDRWRHALRKAAGRILSLVRWHGTDPVAGPLLARLLEQQTAEAERTGVAMLTAVARVHDAYTHAHAQRMTWLAEATARCFGRPAEEIHLIRLAAQFHDIGKIGIPDGLLHKPGPLTEEEWRVMRCHPLLGRHILVQAGGIFAQLSHLVVAHHERWDGRGYPSGLAREGIPLGARILAVVDAYDAMTSVRPYRPPLPEAEARAELRRCAGSLYDPQVVEMVLQVLDAQSGPVCLEQAHEKRTS